MSGVHDLKHSQLTAGFSLPTSVLINKFDINRELSTEIEAYCNENDIEVVGKLPLILLWWRLWSTVAPSPITHPMQI